MRKLMLFAAVCSVAIGLTSCHKRVIRGGGREISETRVVGDFKKIDANGSTPVRVVKDDEYKVIVSGYGNLIDAYKTKVNGDRLQLEFKDGYWNIDNNNISVEVHTPYIDEVKLNGSGRVYVGGGYDLDNFRADISGSGDIEINGNTYKKLEVNISGSGTYNGENTDVQDCYAKISGSGDIFVTVYNYLQARISGSGDIYYYGDPAIDADISGSGKIHSRN